MRALALAISLGLAACGSGGVGSHCSSNGDCHDGLTCYTGMPQGYCSEACAVTGVSTGCSQGICGSVAAVPHPICLAPCGTQLDCRVNYNCSGVGSSNTKACQP